ncbi:MAG: Hint domain-containing protein [Pseudoruegeria sp.]
MPVEVEYSVQDFATGTIQTIPDPDDNTAPQIPVLNVSGNPFENLAIGSYVLDDSSVITFVYDDADVLTDSTGARYIDNDSFPQFFIDADGDGVDDFFVRSGSDTSENAQLRITNQTGDNIAFFNGGLAIFDIADINNFNANGDINATPVTTTGQNTYVSSSGAFPDFGENFVIEEQNSTDFYIDPPPSVVCFAGGTLIRTANGDVPIEHLNVGDRVITADNGLQRICWIGKRYISEQEMKNRPQYRPVRFASGVIGNDVPLTLSQQHRVRISDWKAQLFFGEADVLVSAISLVNDRDVRLVHGEAVTYYHLMFESHELVYSNGAMSESIYPGDRFLASQIPAAREELRSFFPELFGEDAQVVKPIRRVLRKYEGVALRP